jgi:hypothetical protein
MLKRRLVIAVVTTLIMRGAMAQEKDAGNPITVTHIDTGQPVIDFVLCDGDGDGVTDALFTTKTEPALWVLARGAGQSFAPPLAVTIPDGCDGMLVRPGRGGSELLLVRAGATSAVAKDAWKPMPGARLRGGPAPPFLGFAQDQDGDGDGDPLLPEKDGFTLALSTGPRIPVRPPARTERSAGVTGLLSERRRAPVVSFERLSAGGTPRPLYFANDELLALQGDLGSGFGPESDVLLRVPSPRGESTLERTEARLVDVDGDGLLELVLARTKTQGAALTEVRTELLFFRLGAGATGRPVQAILLPGVLSSGPDLQDVDGDGRLDLFLSVFGEELSQQLARRLTGRVKLDYLLYRGAKGAAPFERAPDWSETDAVPEATFLDWSLRHRFMIDDDWTGDGRPDLVVVTVDGGRTQVEVRESGNRDGKIDFARKPSFGASVPTAVLDHRLWALSAGTPAVISRTPTGAVIFAKAAPR